LSVTGWLFDIYAIKDKMVFWLKTDSGENIRLQDNWSHSIYVAASCSQDLESLTQNRAVQQYVKYARFVSRYEKVRDAAQSQVLKLTLNDSSKAVALAKLIEEISYDNYRLYNVDILPAQAYFYEHDIYPLAKCKVSQSNGKLVWQMLDDLKSTDYELPKFKTLNLDVSLKQQDKLPKFTDKIDTITLKAEQEIIEIQGPEDDIFVELAKEVTHIDSDFIFTKDGDEFVFPYLMHRARENNIHLILSRDKMPVLEPPSGGITYYSYGRIHYRPSTIMLYGRVHIDTQNSFILDHSALHGLFEVARICRMALHTCSRATIGRCLSSLQMYHAFKRKLLVPYKPANIEKFKTFNELLIADRGGLIFEPVIGVHENVAEFDFTSLYPYIMAKRNISGETVNCECCPNSKNVVKELGYHICEKCRGIVSESLELPLEKRAKYKMLKKVVRDKARYDIYDARQDALKWLGVVSFGYLGHANSKFGVIDSHIAVCAIDREVLAQARNVVESKGFNCLHGIVDSLWVQKSNATRADYEDLKEPIEKATDYDLSFEGVYKWLAFLPSKQHKNVGVPNRYFGAFEDTITIDGKCQGEIKQRGIETRRHDTPPLFAKFQHEALQIMATGNNIQEVKSLMPKVHNLFEKYKELLQASKARLQDLIFTKTISKDPDAYTANTIESNAIFQLEDEGKTMRAGQVLQYIITDYYRKNSRRRTVPIELINEKTAYDVRRYIELLAQVCNTVTEPFGYVFSAAYNA
jgi:DNA polymerase-2